MKEIPHGIRVRFDSPRLLSGTGVVDKLIDRDAGLFRLLVDFLCRIFIAQIFHDHRDLDLIGVFKLHFQLFKLFFIPGSGDDVKMMPCELEGQFFADPAGCARDQNRLSCPVRLIGLLLPFSARHHGRCCRCRTCQ